ncbi:tudor domain-containing 6-like isoform X3 [Mytilus galloprovincialis]|uniref:tudor domain-containing 6-like isoform X3 n=1 Tax=Mytilus galloprovincialis TaxID=29158 RepID=UPI003F7BBE7E
MDSWDPRRDDFDDKKFNSYDRGPGRNIRKNQDKKEGVQLYITGIPKELSDDGLSNLFSRAGNVLHAKMMVSKRTDLKSTFGFVTMSNLAEAEDAIRQLNKFELREHTLKVAIAMSDEDRQRRRNEKQDQEEFLNSLPSSRMGGQSRSKGSDSDSDKGSVKSGRRIVLTNGQLGGHKQMNNQGGRVTPNPSYMPVQHGPSQLSQRFNQFDRNGLMEYDGQSDCGSYAGARGRGRGASPHNFRNKNSSGYGRGMPQGDRGYGYGGNPGYGNPFGDGYGRGSRQPRYYNDGNYMDYRGFGRGQPYQGGDYNNGYEGYGGGYHEDHSYNNNNYGYTYEDNYHHNTPNYGVHRKGNMDYGKRQNMHSSMESLAGPRKDVKRAIKVDPRPCNVCSTTGVSQCSRCKTPYCSVKCQKSDWERHKQFCQDLRKQNEFATKFENQFEIDVGEEIVEQMKTKVEQSTGGKVDYKTRTDSQKSTIKQHGEKSPKSSDGGKQTTSKSPQKQESKMSPRTEEPRSPVLKKSSLKKSPSKSEAPKQDIDYCTLPLNSEIEVLLADNTSPDHFAVQLQDAEILTAVDELLNKMNNFYNTGGEIVQSPNIGMVYAAQFSADNNWYRARVDAINGDSVAVTYIDYGNTENLLAEKLRLLSIDMTSMKSAAIICQLDGLQAVGGSWSRKAIDKFKTLVIPVIVSGVLTKVIASSVHNRIHKVKVMDHNGVDVGQTLVNDGFATKGGAMDLSQTKSELRSPIMSSELKKVADSLHVGSKENVLVTEKNSPVLFYGQIVQEEIISRFSTFDQALVMEMDSLREIVQYRPKSIGEIVYAKFTDGKWYRAEILSVSGNDASCLFLDYGNKATVNFSLIQQASPLCKSVPQIAVKMKIEGVSEPQTWTKNTLDVFDDLINMDQPKLFEMEIKSVNSDIVEVDFLDEKGKSASALICQTMASESPLSVIMTSSIPKETLSVDGAKEDMMITELSISSNRIYLQKAIQENAERIEDIRMEMTMFCKSNSNSYQPVKGELVCALFPDDGLWYRGDVLEVPGDNYRVQFVDYGNEAVVHPDGICQILQSFVELPRQAVCCTLKGLVLSDLKENQLITLSNTAMNTIITVEAHDIQNDAYVSTFYQKGDGTSINNMLREEEVHAAAEESHEIIMASSVPMETVPVDGSKIEVLITESLDMKHVYIQIYQEKYHQNLQFLTQKLQSYCQSNNEPYMPSKGELVCAKFDADGIWYRAEVLDISGDDYTVHFVDYGNKSFVKSSSIRKINCSLSSMSKQSICCNIVGVDLKSLSEDKLMQFATMAMQGKPVKLQGLEKKDGYYDVKLYTISDENINAMFGSVVEEVQQSAETTPQLRNATAEVIMATSLPQFELPLDGTKIRMKLSDIGDYENMYFQSDLQGDQHTLSQLSSQIGSFCQDNPLPHTPVKGELVCALFSEDSTWYRAEVLNISGEDYEHRFVDYGNCETTKYSNIRKIDETLTVIPKFGVCCNLKGVDLKSLPEEMILECLTLLTSDTVQVQAVQKNEKSYDIVVYTSNGENINQKFMLMPSNQEPVPEMYMASELPMKTLPLDSSTVNMVIMDATSLDTIYLQYCTVEDQETIIDLHRAINVYCQEKASPYKPNKGELVFAKFDSGDSIDWYRAEVLEIVGDTFKVRYVDYGNTSEVRCDQISKINKTLATPPSQTICCRLHQVDLKVFSPEKLLPLINLVRENKPLQVQAVKLKERCYDVLLFTSEGMNVNEQLLVQDTPQPIQSIILTSSLSKTVLPANVEMNAVITEVMDDCVFYLQANIEETKISLDKILEQSHQYCSTNNTQYKPVKGELVCAQFSSDKVWYRANVEDINDGKYLVHYLDFGNQELTTEQSIRKIDPSLAVDPGHCVKCCLHDVPKSEEVKNTLNSLMGVIVNIKVIKEESNLYHMIIINNGINVNQQLKGSSKTPGAGRPKVSEQLQKSTSPKGKTDEASQAQQSLPSSGGSNYLSLKDISKTEPSAKNRFLITYVVDPTEFYCQIADPNEIQKLATLMQGMMCRCEIEDPDPRFRPQVGDLVCAFYPSDGNWYRGNVVEAYQNNTYLIHYLDFGNSELLEAKQIRSMLPEYIEMPLLAFKCSLPDLVPVGPIWDTAAKEKLKIFQAVSLDAEIVRREGETYIVNLAHSEEESKQIIDVSEQLINDGHAKKKSGNNADEADIIQQQIAALQAQLASMGKK